MNLKTIGRLLVCILIPQVIGGLSAYITFEAIDGWYSTLAKPSFNPPNYVFGPVWTLLYLLMGVSLFLILNTEESIVRTRAVLVFGLQLFLNFWWSVFFFGFKRPEVALLEIITLWVAIIWMIFSFRRVKPVAAWLQIPYLLWVTFAMILNAAIYILN